MPDPVVTSMVSSLTAIQDCSSIHSNFVGVYGAMPGCAMFPLVALPVTNATRTNIVENQIFIHHLALKNSRKREQTNKGDTRSTAVPVLQPRAGQNEMLDRRFLQSGQYEFFSTWFHHVSRHALFARSGSPGIRRMGRSKQCLARAAP